MLHDCAPVSQKIFQGFQTAPLRVRFFLFLRWHLTPYTAMSTHLPQEGRILDLGCGHGLFSFLIASTRPKCQVLGIDHDESRIQQVQWSQDIFPNIKFRQSDLRGAIGGKNSFTAISIIDTLHYFSAAEQEKILQQAYQSLSPGGLLLVREVDRSGNLRSLWNRTYEWLATHLKFTKTQVLDCTFRTPPEWSQLLQKIGFSVSWSRCSSIFFADVLFVARKA